MFKLRDYQQDIVSDIRAELQSGKQRILLCASVGAGKMSILTYIATQAAGNGKRIYLVFHTQQLVKQACEWLQNWGARYGIEAASFGKNIDPDALIQVCMVQSIAKRLDKLPAPWLIIEDESHHSAASTYKKIRAAYSEAKVIGFTATPVRLGGELLFTDDGFQSMILKKQTQPAWLTANGYLTPVRLFSQPAKFDMSQVRTTAGDYNEQDLADLMTDDITGTMVGDAIDEYRQHCENQPALAVCVNIAHAEKVAAKFRAAGYESRCIHGGMNKAQRDKMMGEFEAGVIKILCYCQLLGEGVDIPAVTALFFLRPSKSIVTWLQACGRTMRLAKGKAEAFVFDHVGNAKQVFWGYEMGHPSEDFPWHAVLEEMSKKKVRGSKVSQALPFGRCPSCTEIHQPRLQICPHCGYDYLEHAKKEQEEIEIKARLEEYNKKREKIERGKSINSLDDAIAYAKSKGFKTGWAYHYWKVRNARKFGKA
jgi:DNA repair protein RadD